MKGFITLKFSDNATKLIKEYTTISTHDLLSILCLFIPFQRMSV